jgi:hypothetical protein
MKRTSLIRKSMILNAVLLIALAFTTHYESRLVSLIDLRTEAVY